MPSSESVGSGEPKGYAGPVLSEYKGGRKRRKSGKRGKRRSSRKSRKYMKKMYRGGKLDEDGSDEDGSTRLDENESDESNELTENEKSQGGGRRKRKGKTRKGKVSKWITHVKNFSRANKMDFRDALKNPKCKAEYHKMK